MLKIITVCLLQVALYLTAFGQGTAFIYQGQLTINGAPANGNYDFLFQVYDSPFNGNVIGFSPSVGNLPVTNGLFTTSVDVGTGVFSGAPRWLQIQVRPFNTSTFTNLTPRQPLLAAPYSVYAGTASNALNATTAATATSASTATTAGSATTATSALTATSANFATNALNATNSVTSVNFSGSLAGDVIGTQPATVVSKVGGQTAANVASGTVAANGATSANVSSTLVKRDGTGSFAAQSVTLAGQLVMSSTTPTILQGTNLLLRADGSQNFFVGPGVGTTTYTNAVGQNAAVGYQALPALTSGNGNTALGAYACYTTSDGSRNTAIGNGTMVNGGSGSGNIALGYQAGFNANGNNNIDIGHQGNLGENATIRIGTSGAQTDTYLTGTIHTADVQINGSDNIPLEVDSASTFGSWIDLRDTAAGGTIWTIISTANGNGEGAGKLLFDTSSSPGHTSGNALTLTPSGNVGIHGVTSPAAPLQVINALCDGNTWFNSSDRNLKEDFSPITPQTVLEKVAALPITEWRYKTDPKGIRHLGPMAQDFKAAFDLGESDKSIGTVDEGGVALAAIQGLNEKLSSSLKEKDEEIASLKQRLERLEKKLSALEAR